MSLSSRSRLPALATLSVIYFALAGGTLAFSRFEGAVAFVWLAGPALLARLLTLRVRHWGAPLVGCALAGATATAFFGLGPAAALPMLVPDLVEPTIAAFLIRSLIGRGPAFATQARLITFLLAAGVLTPAITAFAGAALATGLGSGSYSSNWLSWFAGHALGNITFTPVAYYIARGGLALQIHRADRRRIFETMAHVALVALISVACFSQETLPLLFLPILPIMLAIFRGGRLPGALAILVLTLISGGFTVLGQGPMSLIDASPGARTQFLQFYLAVSVLTILPAATELGRRRALFRRLRESEARYRLLMESSTDIILNLDPDGTIRFASPSITQIGGYEVLQVLGRNAIDLINPDDLDAVRCAHRSALADPSQTFIVEYRAATGDGSARWFETHTRAVVDSLLVVGVVCAIRDVTHRKALEQRLSHAADTDPLTGLCNRRAFETKLLDQIRKAGVAGGCVALFDLDHFKSVNDNHGHAAGDDVLKGFARQARRCVREHDIVARLGGEEFAVILPGASLLQAQLVCERLRRMVAAMEIPVDRAVVRVTVSGGVAAYRGDSTIEGLLAGTDAALYEAKARGRDRLAFVA